jgi:cholesterol oxidase
VFNFDYVVVGSGFGGSVSALRLAEKGYSVAVLDRGKRWHNSDFPRTNWNIWKYLWAPRIGCRGIQAITLLRDVMILHGCGVGGGSLVYANVLMAPPDEVFRNPPWAELGDWREDLAPHYATARQTLGVTQANCPGDTDHMLQQIAQEMGCGGTFQSTQVGVFFGEPGKTVPDPYFAGAGPERTGCTLCGGCMTGCRHNAKNTLDKNYLFLAERQGARVLEETEVHDICELPGGGYEVHALLSSGFPFRRRCKYSCHGIIMSGGVLGTVPLLLRCKQRGSLPRISDRLGSYVRTNSEALIGSTSRRRDVDYSRGIAIASGFRPDADTTVQMVRYAEGQDFMSLLCTVLVKAAPPWPRILRFVAEIARDPLKFLRLLNPHGWAKRTGIVLVMQSVPNHMNLRLRRRWWWPFAKRTDSDWSTPERIPKYLPIANEVAERLAPKMNGDPSGALPEALFDLTNTAHVLGGCCIGRDPSQGVVDRYGRLFNYENFYVSDGSIIPVNLRVNPSLTITALGEWIMSHVPEKH